MNVTEKIRRAEKQVKAVQKYKRSLFLMGWNYVLPCKSAAAERRRRERVAQLIDATIDEIEDLYRLVVTMVDPPTWLVSPAQRAEGAIIEEKAA